MTRPVGQIEVWDPSPAKIYTITDFVSVYYREVLTSGVGNFTFRVYSHKDFSGTYTYPNIDVGDTVKIWLDWDAVAGNPNFIGKVTKRSGPILTPTGWVREISGLSQGEILLRRHKKNKFYTGTNASVIVTEWANDLGLGVGDITADARQPDIEVRTKTYFDLLRHISDYWLDGANKIKKDFWVDLDGDLVWKVRPIRVAGVESLPSSKWLADAQVIRDVESVKNDIVVYGSADKPKPTDKDSYTEPASSPPPGWSANPGTVDRNNVAPKVGTWFIKGEIGAGETDLTFKYDLPRITIRDINRLLFWAVQGARVPTLQKVRLHAPDHINFFETDISAIGAWTFNDLSLGPGQVYHATENPNGIWTENGSPNWWDIEAIEFNMDYIADGAAFFGIDGLWFYPERWTGSASDAGSQALYGRRDLEVTDDKLHSDTECERRAETVLFQRKDLPIQIKIAVKGNDNVLVGDRLTMTIPSEAITAQPYDVIMVENALTLDNWITQPTMVNSVNTREPLAQSPLDYVIRGRRQLRELAMDEKRLR